MKFLKIKCTLLGLSLIFSLSSMAAQFSKDSLSKAGYLVNNNLSKFLKTQKFPVQFSGEAFEQLGLLRDGSTYGKENTRCDEIGFYSASTKGTPFIKKIVVASDRDGDRVEYMPLNIHTQEMKKIMAKFGKPSVVEVSKEVWPSNSVGRIKYVEYKVNYENTPVNVSIALDVSGCLRATAFYNESLVEDYINRSGDSISGSNALRRDKISDAIN